MRTILRVLLLLALLGGAALLALGLAFGLPAEGIHLIVNGREVSIDHLAGGHTAAAGLAALIALCIIALVLPLALLLGVLLPLLLVLGAVLLVLGAVMGAGALALSPLLLPLALVWWLWRRSRRTVPTAPGAAGTTIGS